MAEEAKKVKKEEIPLFQWLYPGGYGPYKLKWFDLVFAAVLFIIAMAGYIQTLTPSVCAGDSGELTTTVYNMGACHPPGYPLYGIVGKLFCFIPVGNIAYRVNLFSAFAGAVAVVFLYLIMIKLMAFNQESKKPSLLTHFPAVLASFVFAFSMTHWSQAVIGEVYALNAALSAGLLYAMLLWYEEIVYFRLEEWHFAPRLTLLLGFVMGLSLTDHQFPMWYIVAWFLLLFVPVVLLVASEHESKFEKQLGERVVWLVGLVLAGIVAAAMGYFYAIKPALILESHVPKILLGIFIIPVYATFYYFFVARPKREENNWVDKSMTVFMGAFWMALFAISIYLYMLIRAKAVAPLAEPKPLSWGDTQRLDILFNHMLRKQYGTPSDSLRDFGSQLWVVIKYNVEQFNIVNTLFALVGFYALWKKEKMWAIFSLGAVLLFNIVVVRYINFETDPRTISFQEVFFIQEFMIIAIYIGFGYKFFLELATKGIDYVKEKKALQES